MKKRVGFTLIEVMMAVTILAGGLTVLVTAASRSIGIAARAKEYERARHLMALVELQFPMQLDELEEGSDSGSFEGDYSGFSWEREISLLGEEEDELYNIRTRVNWKARNGIKFEEVETFLYLPTAKKAGFIDENASLR